MTRKRALAVTSLALAIGAASLLLPGDKRKTVTLSWSYGDTSEIVFNVYASTNLLAWNLIATVTNLSLIVPADKPQEFFRVTASNVVTHAESL